MFKSERKVDRLNRAHGITTSRVPTVSTTKTNGNGWWNTVALNHEYFTPIVLFVVLFAVLWLTDDKLGWFSFMIRDWWTFAAFMITYLAFAPAFMQEKDKTKKTPLFKKVMVFITIMAVDLALIGNPFNWNWNEPSPPPPAQVAVPQVLWSVKGVAKQGAFVEVKVPVPPKGCTVEWSCQDGAFVGITHKKLPQGIFRSCEVDSESPDFGEVQDLRLTFMSADPESWYKAGFICN